jgi:hypothetical protein
MLRDRSQGRILAPWTRGARPGERRAGFILNRFRRGETPRWG